MHICRVIVLFYRMAVSRISTQVCEAVEIKDCHLGLKSLAVLESSQSVIAEYA